MVGNFNCWDVEIKISSHIQETKYAIRFNEMNKPSRAWWCMPPICD